MGLWKPFIGLFWTHKGCHIKLLSYCLTHNKCLVNAGDDDLLSGCFVYTYCLCKETSKTFLFIAALDFKTSSKSVSKLEKHQKSVGLHSECKSEMVLITQDVVSLKTLLTQNRRWGWLLYMLEEAVASLPTGQQGRQSSFLTRPKFVYLRNPPTAECVKITGCYFTQAQNFAEGLAGSWSWFFFFMTFLVLCLAYAKHGHTDAPINFGCALWSYLE